MINALGRNSKITLWSDCEIHFCFPYLLSFFFGRRKGGNIHIFRVLGSKLDFWIVYNWIQNLSHKVIIKRTESCVVFQVSSDLIHIIRFKST